MSKARDGCVDLIFRREPHGLDEAAGQHNLPRSNGLSPARQIVGQPGERRVRMAHHVGSDPTCYLDTIDEGPADHIR